MEFYGKELCKDQHLFFHGKKFHMGLEWNEAVNDPPWGLQIQDDELVHPPYDRRLLSQGRKGSSSSSSSAAGPGSLRQRINRGCGSSSGVLSFLCFSEEGTLMVRPPSSSLPFGWLPFLPNSSTTLTDSGFCGETSSTLMVGISVTDLRPHAWGSVGGKRSGTEQILHRQSVLNSSVVTVNLK